MKKIGLILSGFFVSSLLFFGCGGLPSSSVGGPGKVLGPPGGEADDQKIVTFYVIGKGLQPENSLSKGEAVLMAERAAVADGYRQLIEKLRGVYVEAYLRAGKGTVDQETIQVQTQSWLRGTEIMEVTQGEYGITSARLSLRIHFTRDGMIWWPVGIGRDVKPSFSEGSISGGSS